MTPTKERSQKNNPEPKYLEELPKEEKLRTKIQKTESNDKGLLIQNQIIKKSELI
jgi:hypothetical protein